MIDLGDHGSNAAQRRPDGRWRGVELCCYLLSDRGDVLAVGDEGIIAAFRPITLAMPAHVDRNCAHTCGSNTPGSLVPGASGLSTAMKERDHRSVCAPEIGGKAITLATDELGPDRCPHVWVP